MKQPSLLKGPKPIKIKFGLKVIHTLLKEILLIFKFLSIYYIIPVATTPGVVALNEFKPAKWNGRDEMAEKRSPLI